MIKILKKTFMIIISIVAIIIVLGYATGYDYFFNGIRITYLHGDTNATIDDGQYFKNNIIHKNISTPFEQDSLYNKIQLPKLLKDNLNETETASLIVIRNGKILHEEYSGKYTARKKTNSFSIAKGITTLLLGKAIEEDRIKSDNELFINYYPYFASGDDKAKRLRLIDLARMQSGFDWNEKYRSFLTLNAKAYYGSSLSKSVLSRGMKREPAHSFEYLSGDTQLLGFAIRKAVKTPLALYLSEKIWKPLEMESEALWSTDEYGMEKTFCCIHAIPRDYAKIGQLILQNGNWKGKQIISAEFIQKMTTATSLSNGAYGAGIWINTTHPIKHYFFWGFLGQYIIVIPEKQMVIVRTGNDQNIRVDEKRRSTNVAFLVEEITKIF